MLNRLEEKRRRNNGLRSALHSVEELLKESIDPNERSELKAEINELKSLLGTPLQQPEPGNEVAGQEEVITPGQTEEEQVQEEGRISALLKRSQELHQMEILQLSECDQHECVVCHDNPRGGCRFMPCGHAVCCVECSKQLIDTTRECPLCRANIQHIQNGDFPEVYTAPCITENTLLLDSCALKAIRQLDGRPEEKAMALAKALFVEAFEMQHGRLKYTCDGNYRKRAPYLLESRTEWQATKKKHNLYCKDHKDKSYLRPRGDSVREGLFYEVLPRYQEAAQLGHAIAAINAATILHHYTRVSMNLQPEKTQEEYTFLLKTHLGEVQQLAEQGDRFARCVLAEVLLEMADKVPKPRALKPWGLPLCYLKAAQNKALYPSASQPDYMHTKVPATKRQTNVSTATQHTKIFQRPAQGVKYSVKGSASLVRKQMSHLLWSEPLRIQ